MRICLLPQFAFLFLSVWCEPYNIRCGSHAPVLTMPGTARAGSVVSLLSARLPAVVAECMLCCIFDFLLLLKLLLVQITSELKDFMRNAAVSTLREGERDFIWNFFLQFEVLFFSVTHVYNVCKSGDNIIILISLFQITQNTERLLSPKIHMLDPPHPQRDCMWT